jgi:2-polyprenyl-3-methyl-5-hydroxy-6-metoxy-1,4-benzoquinol methylase
MNPRPSDDDYHEEYFNKKYREYFCGPGGPKMLEWLSDHNRAIRYCGIVKAGLEQKLITATNVLDFGGGLGIISYLLQDNFKSKCTIVEPNEEWRSYAEPYVIQAVSTLDEVTTGPFDFIVLSHVLEHMLYPTKTLIDFHPHLVTGGTILIEVPLFSPSIYHPQVFTPKSMQLVVELSGFRAIGNGLLHTGKSQPDGHWVLISKVLEEV